MEMDIRIYNRSNGFKIYKPKKMEMKIYNIIMMVRWKSNLSKKNNNNIPADPLKIE